MTRTRALLATGVVAVTMAFVVPVHAHDDAADFIALPEWTAAQPSLPAASDAEVDRLLTQLRDADDVIRAIAAAALGQTGSPRAVKPLLAAMKDEDDHVQVAAAQSLCMIGGTEVVEPVVTFLGASKPGEAIGSVIQRLARMGSPAAEPLASLLKTSDTARRKMIITALARVKDDPRARDVFVRGQDTFAEISVNPAIETESRIETIDMIARFGDAKGVDALCTVLVTLPDPEGCLRPAAATALATIKDPGGVKALFTTAKDKLPEVRAAALLALGKTKDARAIDVILSATKDSDQNVRNSAIRALGNTAGDRAVQALLSMLNGKDGRLRATTVAALGQTKDPRAVEPLISIVKTRLSSTQPADPCVNVAIFALGRIGDPRAVDILQKLAAGADANTRDLVCRSLSGIKDSTAATALVGLIDPTRSGIIDEFVGMGTRAINPLIGALKNPNPFVRQTAAGFFRRVRDAGSITPLIAALADENARVRAQSALALGIQQDSRAIQALVPLLSDKDQLVHECAAIALGQFGDARAQSDILAALNAHSGYSLSDMRAPAIAALGKLKDPKAIPLILNTAVYWDMEDSRELRAACVDALTAISGQQFGHDYCRWLGWAAAEGNWKPSKQEHPATTERSTTK